MSRTSTSTLTISLPPPPRSWSHIPAKAVHSPSHLCHTVADELEVFPPYVDIMPPSTTTTQVAANDNGRDAKVTIWQRLLSPLLFVAFLVSWALVDRSARGEKENDHKGWNMKVTPATPEADEGKTNTDAVMVGKQEFVWRAGKRRLAKKEAAEAMEMRAKVAVALVGLALAVAAVVFMGGRWMMQSMGEWVVRT